MAWHDTLSKKYQTRKPNKYGAEKVKIGTRTYDSKGECEFHGVLNLMERGGLINNIRHHPPALHLTGNVNYKIDYIFFDIKRNMDIGAEFKGIMTERFKVICQLWPEHGPIPMQIWAKKGNRIYMVKEISGKSA
jgi:hypothetical protein